MPNVQQVLNEEIRRLARKEIKTLEAQIAALKKRVAALEKGLKIQPSAAEQTPAAESAAAEQKAEKTFSCKAKRIKALRLKLQLTQTQFAKLLNTSPITVCHWENGKNVPSGKMKERLQNLRSISKKELNQLLAEKEITAKETKQAQPAENQEIK